VKFQGTAIVELRSVECRWPPVERDSGSPDGRWLAHLTLEDGKIETSVSPFPGPGERTRIAAAVGYPLRWSRDGKKLFFWSGTDMAWRSQLMAVDVQPGPVFRAGIPQPLFKLGRREYLGCRPGRQTFPSGTTEL
jgi:hypothetical protein